MYKKEEEKNCINTRDSLFLKYQKINFYCAELHLGTQGMLICFVSATVGLLLLLIEKTGRQDFMFMITRPSINEVIKNRKQCEAHGS